jgi:hypothetical protein
MSAVDEIRMLGYNVDHAGPDVYVVSAPGLTCYAGVDDEDTLGNLASACARIKLEEKGYTCQLVSGHWDTGDRVWSVVKTSSIHEPPAPVAPVDPLEALRALDPLTASPADIINAVQPPLAPAVAKVAAIPEIVSGAFDDDLFAHADDLPDLQGKA